MNLNLIFKEKRDYEKRAAKNGLKEQRFALFLLTLVADARKNRSKERM